MEFLYGKAYLQRGEAFKARTYFLSSSYHILTCPALQTLVRASEVATPRARIVHFFSAVLRLFEEASSWVGLESGCKKRKMKRQRMNV